MPKFDLVEPRFVRIQLVGTVDTAQISALMDALEDAVSHEPFFLLELVMGRLDTLVPESRRIAADRLQKLPNRAIAVSGGSFRQNIMAKLVLTAVEVLTQNKANISEFFDTSDDAGAWLRDYAARQEAT